MATVDFKPFAIAGTPNVISQAAFLALFNGLSGVGDVGFETGTALSDQLNKVWRQSSVMSAVLANFISDLTGDNVLDNGNLAAIELSLSNAVSKGSYAVDTGATNAFVVALTPTRSARRTGLVLPVKMAHGCTGACTLNYGAGAFNIKNIDGSNPLNGQIISGAVHLFVDDGTNLILLNPQPGTAFSKFVTGGTTLIPSWTGATPAAGTFITADGGGNLQAGPLYQTSALIASLAPSTPATILTATSLGGGLDANFWIVGAAVSGPGSSYAIVNDVNGGWVICGQGNGGVTPLTFSASGPLLQLSHGYGSNSPVPWFGFRMF